MTQSHTSDSAGLKLGTRRQRVGTGHVYRLKRLTPAGNAVLVSERDGSILVTDTETWLGDGYAAPARRPGR